MYRSKRSSNDNLLSVYTTPQKVDYLVAWPMVSSDVQSLDGGVYKGLQL